MFLYAVLLDASSYGAYAASGGNLAAPLLAGAIMCVSFAALELLSEAVAAARMRAAGTTIVEEL